MSETLSLARVRAFELVSTVQDALAEPRAQAALCGSAGGSLMLGASGAISGLISGGALGAACGVVPAFFTFGLSIPIGAALGSGAGLCAGTAVGGGVGLVSGGAAGYLYKSSKKDKGQEEHVARVFRSDELDQVIPLPPKYYPENLQGIIWMDQAGAFGHTDVPFSAPDLAISFGDTAFSTLNTDTRTLSVDVAGPAWQWLNNRDAYLTFTLVRKMGFFYLFEFNEDYSFAQIYPSCNLGVLGKWHFPKFLMSFTMELQTPPTDIPCPPTSSTLYVDRARCAKWDRVSKGLLSPLLGKYGVFHYYVHQIVDGDGNRVQPFYDACIAYSAKKTQPDEAWAARLGVEALAAGGSTSFVGLRGSGSGSSSTQKA